jgi:predicted nuclease of predicted toxin-antitoxin system
MAALYANENFPHRVVTLLRTMGHDILTTQDAGKAGQAIPDDEVLAFATQNNRAVITLNRRDFIRLHQQNSEHAGIIVCKVDADNAALAARIHETIEQAGNLSKQLIRINRPWSPEK